MANRTTKPVPEPEVRHKVEKGGGTKLIVPEGNKVQLLQDHLIEYPELYMQVYIAGNAAIQASFAEMLARASCYIADDPREADVVVFTGGPDVHPGLYGLEEGQFHPKTLYNRQRDQDDMALYADCIIGRIPMIGICRGAQFGHVMNKGTLFQHVDNHCGDHPIWDLDGGGIVQKASSTHHQMVMKNNRMDVIGVAHKSRKRYTTAVECEEGQTHDVEAFYYKDTCFLGFQGHPEYRNYPAYTKWCLQKIEKWIVHDPRIKPEGGLYRLQKNLVLDEGEDERVVR